MYRGVLPSKAAEEAQSVRSTVTIQKLQTIRGWEEQMERRGLDGAKCWTDLLGCCCLSSRRRRIRQGRLLPARSSPGIPGSSSGRSRACEGRFRKGRWVDAKLLPDCERPRCLAWDAAIITNNTPCPARRTRPAARAPRRLPEQGGGLLTSYSDRVLTDPNTPPDLPYWVACTSRAAQAPYVDSENTHYSPPSSRRQRKQI